MGIQSNFYENILPASTTVFSTFSTQRSKATIVFDGKALSFRVPIAIGMGEVDPEWNEKYAR